MTARIAISKCGCCGKPLSDPISVKLGIGPICRINLKMKEANQKSGNLFGNTAQYTWGIDDIVLWIKDTGTDCRSVTNDMDNILEEIQTELAAHDTRKMLYDFHIMYLDSMVVWDGVELQHSKGLITGFRFFSINERSYQAAKDKLLLRRA